MRHYFIAEMRVTDRAWVADYVQAVTPMVERYGGRCLARTSHVDKVEGGARAARHRAPHRMAQPRGRDGVLRERGVPPVRRRVAGSTSEFILVPGEDVTGAARMAD